MWKGTFLAVVALAGCTGADDGGPEPSALGHWQLSLTLARTWPCPGFDLPDAYGFTVEEGAGGLQFTPDDPVRRIFEASATVDGVGDNRFMRVEVSGAEPWTGSSGQAYANLDYELFGELDGSVTGAATAYFYWDTETSGSTCRYWFDVTGAREAP